MAQQYRSARHPWTMRVPTVGNDEQQEAAPPGAEELARLWAETLT